MFRKMAHPVFISIELLIFIIEKFANSLKSDIRGCTVSKTCFTNMLYCVSKGFFTV